MFRISFIFIFLSFTTSLSAQEINITSKRKLPVQKKELSIDSKGVFTIYENESNAIVSFEII